jgi:hypothetical protein
LRIGRPGRASGARIAKIYDLMHGFDWVNKGGICELATAKQTQHNAAIVADQERQVARILGGRQKPVARHKRRQET